ncbi:formylmethionine deformylase, partial [Tanacetum coccineum]
THYKAQAREGYFTSRKLDWSRVVKAGDRVLHEPAREVYPGEIGSKRHPPKEVYEAEDKRPFDTLTSVSKVSSVSVPGYAAAVERFLEVEVTGLNQYGQPIKVDDSGLRAC